MSDATGPDTALVPAPPAGLRLRRGAVSHGQGVYRTSWQHALELCVEREAGSLAMLGLFGFATLLWAIVTGMTIGAGGDWTLPALLTVGSGLVLSGRIRDYRGGPAPRLVIDDGRLLLPAGGGRRPPRALPLDAIRAVEVRSADGLAGAQTGVWVVTPEGERQVAGELTDPQAAYVAARVEEAYRAHLRRR